MSSATSTRIEISTLFGARRISKCAAVPLDVFVETVEIVVFCFRMHTVF